MLRARANGETFVSATMCPQRVLVCQGLYDLDQWHVQNNKTRFFYILYSDKT